VDLLIGCGRSLPGSSGGVVWRSDGIGPVSARGSRALESWRVEVTRRS
jgi:hypothetical protein